MIRRGLATILRRSWTVLPRSRVLFKLARMYADFYTGDNLSDMRLNGELRVLRRILPRCQTAFDVGANVGDWAALALAANPKLVIHCFEPASTTFATLTARTDLPKAQVHLNNFGLSDRPSEARLFLHANSSDINSLYGDPEAIHTAQTAAAPGVTAVTGTETIRLETLDGYCAARRIDRIDYAKLDVEGHELSVLRGARDMLARQAIQYVQVEYGNGYLAAGARFADVFRLMADCGYRCHKIAPKGAVPWPAYDLGQENFMLSNWLFARAGSEV